MRSRRAPKTASQVSGRAQRASVGRRSPTTSRAICHGDARLISLWLASSAVRSRRPRDRVAEHHGDEGHTGEMARGRRPKRYRVQTTSAGSARSAVTLISTASAEHDSGGARSPFLGEEHRAEHGEAHERVVVAAVDHAHDDQRIEAEQHDGRGAARSPPDQPSATATATAAPPVVQPRDEHRAAGERAADGRERDEHRAVDGRRVAPAAGHQVQERVVGEVVRHVRVRAHAVPGQHPAVHRVRPQVVRAGGLERDGEQHQRADRGREHADVHRVPERLRSRHADPRQQSRGRSRPP